MKLVLYELEYVRAYVEYALKTWFSEFPGENGRLARKAHVI